MLIKQLEIGYMDNFCYIVGCEKTRKALVIDPGRDVDRIVSAAEKQGLEIEAIVNTHAHGDHTAGNAELKSLTGAKIIIHALDAAGYPKADVFLKDEKTLQLGEITFDVIHSPGHTPGGTTWTWQSCQDNVCEHMVYADSLNAVSGPSYRFSDEKAHPGVLGAFRKSLATVADLPCDILLAPHPDMIDMEGKLARLREHSGTNPFVDSGACKTYAARAMARLDKRLAKENAK